MCERQACGSGAGLTRRAFLRRASTLALAVPLLPLLAEGAAAEPLSLPGVTVRPRHDWARGLAPTGPLVPERAEDVRFLLVHHTASSNRYGPESVPELIRGFFAMHTGPSKNWPDVAYNFFVDRYGTVWEGRSGSLSGPVQPDATGGSQGFAQLCCFIGDHQAEPPTEESRRSMVALLAALADVYGIDTTAGATAAFVSRGSNRWPAGTPVTAATISGHRDMSLTACPGDAAYPLVRDVFPVEVTTLRATRSALPPTPAPPTASTSAPPVAPALEAVPSAAPSSPPPARGDADAEAWTAPVVLASGGAVAAGVIAGIVVRGRRRQREAGAQPTPAGATCGWRVHDPASTAADAPEPDAYAQTVGTVHEQGARSLVAVVVSADRPSTVVRAALDAGRHTAHEVDGQVERWQRDPARVAALLVSRSVSAGYAAVSGDRPALAVAAVLVLGGTVTVAATEESMGVLLSTDGAVRRPVLDRPAGPGGAFSLYRTACADVETVAVALASPTPASFPGAGADRLPDLCRGLAASGEANRLLANFHYDYYGATGTEAAVLAIVHDAVVPVPPAAPGGW